MIDSVVVCGYRYPVNSNPNSILCRVMAANVAGKFGHRGSSHTGITIMPQEWDDRDEDGWFRARYEHRTEDYQHETLLHEIIHAIEYELIQSGEIKNESDEAHIDGIARELCKTLKLAGIWQMPKPTGQLVIPFVEFELFREIALRTDSECIHESTRRRR